MKNKKILIGILIFMMMLSMTLIHSVAKAALGQQNFSTKCPNCGEMGTTTYSYYDAGLGGKHFIIFTCDKCGKYLNSVKEHFAYGYIDVNESYHKSICKCTKVMQENMPHNYSWVPISSTQCKGTCKQCGHTITHNHNFSNGSCTYCGLSNDAITEFAGDDRNAQYFVVENKESTQMKVHLTVKGISLDANKYYRQLEFDDYVPANTTRIYVKCFKKVSIGDFITVVYYDVGTGNKGPLAVCGPQRDDSNSTASTSNFSVSKNSPVEAKIPTNNPVVTNKWEEANGTTVTFDINSMDAVTYLWGAINNNNRDWMYLGVRGDSASSTNELKVDAVQGKLQNGQVIITFENNHKHTFTNEYERNLVTHTYVSKCTSCGETVRGNAENHSWDKQHKCIVCGYQGSHTGGTATCTEGAICTGCGAEYTSPLGHDVTDVPEANCTTPQKCKRCGEIVQEALGHNYETYISDGATGHHQTCTKCGASSSIVNHTFTTTLVKTISAPTVSHCYLCTLCNYEKDVKVHTMTPTPQGKNSSNQYYHRYDCKICNDYSVSSELCSFTSVITVEPTCTANGNRRYTCKVCNQTYDETIAKTGHSYNGEWQKDLSYHWKICEKCGEIDEDSKDKHTDNSPKDGRCDVCDYLIAIAPKVSISSDQIVKEDEEVSFYVNVQEGTQPLKYQWFYRSKREGNTGTQVNGGATGQTLTLTADRTMNDRYYYCEVTNAAATVSTPAAHLTVYYPFKIGNTLEDTTINKAKGSHTFSVTIGDPGNPDNYTYQWYMAKTKDEKDGHGTKLNGAVYEAYTVTPTSNIHEDYYYCVVSNGEYEATTNRAKVVADIVEPKITLGTYSNTIINKNSNIVIPFIVTDTGEGFDSSEFEPGDIIVKVDGNVVTGESKNLSYKGNDYNNYNYELTLSGVTGNGTLSFEIQAGAIKDRFDNPNNLTNLPTKIKVDNTLPLVKFESVTGDINGKYLNKEDTIKVSISVEETNGIANALEEGDIEIKVAGRTVEAQKSIVTKDPVGNKYYYELTLKNITGDGDLTVTVKANTIQDKAGNYNVETSLSITNKDEENLVIDNTAPVITAINTTLEGYSSGKIYPTSLEAYHQNWSNTDIYVTIVATDAGGEIDYYMKSVGNNRNYALMESNQETITESVNSNIYYKVYDKAGNSVEGNKEIKLDKITPNKPEMSLFETRLNGTKYIYDPNASTEKNIAIIPTQSTIIDTGLVQSGINKDQSKTFYTVKFYSDISKTDLKSTNNYAYNKDIILTETGYYEIQMTMEDIAGNQVLSDVYEVLINKQAENTIRVSNLNDIGSGVKKVTIEITDSSNNKVIDPIVVENPYNEVIKNVKLSKGTFKVTVTIEDKVGNIKVLTDNITNNF